MKDKLPTSVRQLAHRTIPAPTERDMELLMILNKIYKRLAKDLEYEKKEYHGTNWQHTMSIFTDGIKTEIPDEERTSSVTELGHKGFYVDTSPSGETHAKEFAEMAAYGSADLPSDSEYKQDQELALKNHDTGTAKFEKHKKSLANPK